MSSTGHQQETSPHDTPLLLCELEPWHRVFLQNLGDVLLRRQPPPIEISAQPIPVPDEHFVETGVHAEAVLESYGGHIVFVTLVYLVCTLPMFHRAPKLQSPFENAKVEYYPVSEYLPPLKTGDTAEMKPRHGAPKLARQEILSLPPEPDNNHQTIVTPPKVKLKEDVALPNIVAWTPVPAAQPVAASARAVSQLKVPQFTPPVIEPTADLSQLKPKLLVPPELRPTVVEPTADVSQLKTDLHSPTMLPPSVVEPALSADQLKLKAGELNIAQLEPQVAAPKLPVAAQRSSGVTGDSAGKPDALPAEANPGPPPSMQGAGSAQGQGQLIALGLNPADVRGPINAPSGNRSGEFHASPSGKADAPGTPNVSGSGSGAGKGPSNGTGLPPGITVGAPPPGSATSAVAGTPAKPASGANPGLKKETVAALLTPMSPNVRDRRPPPPAPPTVSDDPDASLQQRVFGSKRYYRLVMNMPNLTSVTGSWIIHFAELTQSNDKSVLAAPVATTQVDPAYPAEVLRDKVEGTVTLYAIIRADGTVDTIRVLDGLDSRLDANAVRALAHWHFRPGTRNGEPVALEAVVQVPFRLRHAQ